MTISTMMDEPLGIAMIFDRGERLFGQSVVETYDGNKFNRATYAEVAARARRLAAGLATLGVRPGDRVGTFCWNRQEHLEAYLAVPAMGSVLHTINVRLFPIQFSWIVNHAEDRVLLVDSSLLPAIAPVLAECASLHSVVVIGDWDGKTPERFGGKFVRYEELLTVDPMIEWPVINERSAAAMCYTSGTTGNPKGVVYSHRSIFLHSLASLGSDAFAVSNADRILMVPAMFHANAWGLPYSGWFAGSDLIMPGSHLQPERIAEMVAATRSTLTAAVPTILNDLLAMNERATVDLSSFRTIIAGGSAVSQHLIERMKAEFGVDVVQGWGMTETSPMCVLSHPPRNVARTDEAKWRSMSGRPVAGMKVRIVGDEGTARVEDGQAIGRLQLKGPWVTSSYFRTEPSESPLTEDGWLETGDVGSIDSLGYVQITDRTKDLIKSGGEWISSIDLENEIAQFPGIIEAAVIAVPDTRWEERPLAVIVGLDQRTINFDAVRNFLASKVAGFMIPEYWTQLNHLPKTSIGKIDKRRLREDAASGAMPYQRREKYGAAGKI